MIHTAIQKLSVVRYQNKTLLPPQIIGHQTAGRLIQMIGWLIQQQKMPRLQKHSRQQGFGLLAVG